MTHVFFLYVKSLMQQICAHRFYYFFSQQLNYSQKNRDRKHKPMLFNPPPEPPIVEEPPVSEEPVIAKAEEVISFAAAKFGPPPHANNTILCNRLDQEECEENDEDCEWKEFPNNNDKSKGNRPNADGMCKRKPDNSRRLNGIDESACKRTLPMWGNHMTCLEYEDTPLNHPTCEGIDDIVPKVVHIVSKDGIPRPHHIGMAAQNPGKYNNDSTRPHFILPF